MSSRDEGPVYYREIQKCAYLTRLSNDVGTKLRPLGGKKVANKPMWTQFCVHNGRTPYLEQYPEQDSSATHSHKPVWKVCLKAARHITASVKPHIGDQYDFLIDTENGSVRMLAQDWESMQDWVSTLRNTLHELKIVGRGENVYCGPPAPAAPRAPARDPTSPLPPTPPVPPDRVPGIDLTPVIRNPQPSLPSQETPTQSQESITQPLNPTTQPQNTSTQPQNTPTRPQNTPTQPQNTSTRPQVSQNAIRPQISLTESGPILPAESIDISNWDTPFTSLPSTSQTRSDPKKSVAKICGQNICLDDSIFKRTSDVTESDDEFLADIDKTSDVGDSDNGYKQRLVVGEKTETINRNGASSNRQATNITVIQVSNKDPPHTAIPILGPETNVFDFNFKEKLTIQPDPNFVNIVNTEQNNYGTTFSKVNDFGTTTNDYGTTFSQVNAETNEFGTSKIKSENNDYGTTLGNDDYGHLSMTTTVNLTGENNLANENEELYERLCLASTSNSRPSPLAVKKNMNLDTPRKSSLPNLESNQSNYEYLFLSNNNSNVNEVNSNGDSRHNHVSRVTSVNNTSVNRVNSSNNDTNRVNSSSNDINRVNSSNNDVNRVNSVNNTSVNSVNSATNDTNRVNSSNNDINRVNSVNNTSVNRVNSATNDTNRVNSVNNTPVHRVNSSNNDTSRVNSVNVRVNPVSDLVRVNSVERSRSQNAYDSAPGTRENIVRRVQNNSPKRKEEMKNDKTDPQPKPIWKRGFTELSLLTRRAIGQVKRHDSPTRQDNETHVSSVVPPVKVVHRPRPEVRVDSARRRSNSLSNGSAPLPPAPAPAPLQSLRARQAAALRAEQRRGAALVAPVSTRPPHPIFTDYNNQVWVCWWGGGGGGVPGCFGGRGGDRVRAVRGAAPRDAAHAKQLLLTARAHTVDILFQRVPLANIYVLNKREQESLGIKLDGECNIVQIEAGSPAGRAALPARGWALTEVNHRPINLIKGGEEDMHRLSAHGSEVSVLIQPSALVKKLRAALKGNKSLLGLR